MTFDFTGKTALITGGTTGIGFATARRLIDAGATVIVTGRNPETLEHARSELGGRATVIASDAADPAAVRALSTRSATASATSTCSSSTPASRASRPSRRSPSTTSTPCSRST